LTAFAAILSLMTSACGLRSFEHSLLRRTQIALFNTRFTQGRLADQAWHACAVGDSSAAPVSRCGTPQVGSDDIVERVSVLAEEVTRVSATDSSAETLHAAALIELRTSTDARGALDRAIGLLERANAAAPNDAALLNDLAVAYLELGERHQLLIPLLRALETIDAAVRIAPRGAMAFNRALILERLHLVASAGIAWKAVEGSEKDSAWSVEARQRSRELAAHSDSLAVRFYTQRARESLFPLLARWSQAVQDGLLQRADSLLDVARVGGDSAVALGGDDIVVRTVASLAAHRNGDSQLVHAVGELSRGVALHDAGSCEDGVVLLARAERVLRSQHAPLARWASFYLAACEANETRFADADDRLFKIIRDASVPRESALRGKALWVRGVIALRRGNYELANRYYREARRQFIEAGDAKNEAAVSYLLSEGLGFAGQVMASQAEALRGLRELSPHRRSHYLHNLLLQVAAHARSGSMRHAALDIDEEALRVDGLLGVPAAFVYALWTRAEDLAAVGDTARAFETLDSATTVARVLTAHPRARADADIALVRGRLLLTRNPRRALDLFDTAIVKLRFVDAEAYLPEALFQSALAARAIDDRGLATRRLQDAISAIERQRSTFVSTEARAAFYETTERVFDAAVMTALDAGHADSAFILLERGRVALSPRRDDNSGARASLARIRALLKPGTLFLDYALLPDRIAIWYASSAAIGYRMVPTPRASVVALAREMRRDNDKGAGRSEPRAQLHSLLLEPMDSLVRGMTDLMIVPDRELQALPFAALWNARTRRFVVEDYAIRMEPSAAFVLEAAATAHRGRPLSALVVGNPHSTDGDENGLPPLLGADLEAQRVGDIYTRSTTLTGVAASRTAIVNALPRYGVFHFAGHAVFNGDAPELSYLAVSTDSADASGRLSAWEISRLDLSKIELVVLSACHTLSSQSSRSGPVAGLAYSFLRAGAPASVSTLWNVDDRVIGDIVASFHRRFYGGTPAHVALREAQIEALSSTRSELRKPAAWAAVIYTGP
jgi:CHAT domain-containing protein/Flp pilus assembly protein TadD